MSHTPNLSPPHRRRFDTGILVRAVDSFSVLVVESAPSHFQIFSLTAFDLFDELSSSADQLHFSVISFQNSMSKHGSTVRCLLLQLLFLHLLSSRVSAIRKDIGFRDTQICRTTVQGRYLLSDDNGHVCDSLSIDPKSRCCPMKGERFSCNGCDPLSRCCNSYEYCVSCCLNPSKTRENEVTKLRIAKASTAGTYGSVFDFCAARCRHNSWSVVHENAYISEFHHCFALPSNRSGRGGGGDDTRLVGVNVVIGGQGESCDSVCRSKGQSCIGNKLTVLNDCDIMRRYMSCKGGCLASIGSDQPAEVFDDAPKDLNPGACLYTKVQSMLLCDGSHRHTQRLCPCA